MATQQQVGAHLDLSRQAVADLVQRGILPSAGPGDLDIDACRIAYIRNLRAAAAGRSDDELTRQRARVSEATAIKIERENLVAAGELIPKAEIVAALQEVFARCRARLLAIPSKLAPRLTSMASAAKIKEVLTDSIHDALDELARTRGVPLSEIEGRPGDGGGGDRGDEGMEPAAKADRKRVGRSVPKPKPRGKRRAG